MHTHAQRQICLDTGVCLLIILNKILNHFHPYITPTRHTHKDLHVQTHTHTNCALPHQYDMSYGNSPKQLSFRVRVEHHMACIPAAWARQRLRPQQLSIRHLQVYTQTQCKITVTVHCLLITLHGCLLVMCCQSDIIQLINRPDWNLLTSLKTCRLVWRKAYGRLCRTRKLKRRSLWLVSKKLSSLCWFGVCWQSMSWTELAAYCIYIFTITHIFAYYLFLCIFIYLAYFTFYFLS